MTKAETSIFLVALVVVQKKKLGGASNDHNAQAVISLGGASDHHGQLNPLCSCIVV